MMSKFSLLRFYRSVVLTGVVLVLLTVGLPARALAISGQNIVALTNQQRAAVELPVLNWNGALAQSAWQKAQDMCNKGYWAHTAPDGTTGWTFMSQSGYAYTLAGENLARGFDTDAGVVNGWMASPGHRANILKDGYQDIGVGSASCNFEGVPTTFVVAHYGATTAKPVNSQTIGKTAAVAKRQPAQAKPQLSAPTSVQTPKPTPQPSPPAPPAPAISFGQRIWQLAWQNADFNEWPAEVYQRRAP